MDWLNRINWLQKLAAGPPSIQPFVNDRRENCVGVFNAFLIKDQLKAMGFRWDNGRLAWYVPATQWPAVQGRVEAIVSGRAQPAPRPQAPVAPQAPAQRPQPGQAIQPQPGSGVVQKGKDGKEYVCINIPFQKKWLNDQFKGYGFRFNWGDGRTNYEQFAGIKAWIMPLDAVQRNPEIVNALQEFQIPGLPGAAPTPKAETPPAVQQPERPTSKRTWLLGKSRQGGVFVAMSEFTQPQGLKGWDWEDIDLNEGQSAANEIKSLIEPIPEGFTVDHMVKDQTGKYAVKKEAVVIQGPTPDSILDPLKKIREDNEQAEEGEFAPDPYQQKVVDTFTQTDQHIMMNALAGTGKTSTLKSLAKVKKQMEKQLGKALRWDYVVFNAKNKVEGTEKFKPYGVGVATSHGFLGEILNDSAIPGIPTGKDCLWLPAVKKKYGAHTRMSLVLDNLMHGDGKYARGDKDRLYQAKLMIQKIASLCKQFAIDPADPSTPAEIDRLVTRYEFDTRLPTEEEKKEMERGRAINLRDYRQEIIGDTQRILTESLPGRTDKLYERLYAEREQEISELETQIRRGAWSLSPRERKRAEKSLLKAKKAMSKVRKLKDMGQFRDHDDTLWYATLPQYIDQLRWPKSDVVLVDEVQDFNECQRRMLAMLAKNGTRLVAVGDPNQCHPPGTMISLTGGKEKPIEEVCVGDQIVTYNTRKTYYPGTVCQGRKVLEVAKRHFQGDLIKIQAGDKQHFCTPNHRCLVKLHKTDGYGLYLMVKGSSARIGICKMIYSITPGQPAGYKTAGMGMRCRQEKAEKAWLLAVYDTERDARVAEAVNAIRFNLPQITFVNSSISSMPQDVIDEIYRHIGDNSDKARNCLNYFGRLWEYPLWQRRIENNWLGVEKCFVTQACNLIDGAMKVRTFDGSNRGGAWEVARISREAANCDVYSLSVEQTEIERDMRLYIANGIVTHNSIYRFRGADSQSFGRIQQLLSGLDKGAAVLPLPENHRCGAEIIDWVNANCEVMQKLPPEERLKADKNHTEKARKRGSVTGDVPYEEAFANILNEWDRRGGAFKQETAFIARTNAPLAKAAMQLMKAGVDFEIIGKDLSTDLTKHIGTALMDGLNPWDEPPNPSLEQLPTMLQAFRERAEDRWHGQVTRVEDLKEIKEFTGLLVEMIEHLQGNNGYDPRYLDTNPISPNRGQPLQVRDAIGFRDYLQKRFGYDMEGSEKDVAEYAKRDKRKFVTLTTAHRSKGMEYSRVFILSPELFPHPKAKSAEELVQEQNAFYVACTRAERNLIFTLTPEDDEESQPRRGRGL